MDILDSLPEIHHVPVDLVPRVDAFTPLGPPPHGPRLLRGGESSRKGLPLGWKRNNSVPFFCLSRPPNLQVDLRSNSDVHGSEVPGVECSTSLGALAGLESGTTRASHTFMGRSWRDCGAKLESDGSERQASARQQGFDLSCQPSSFRQTSLPGTLFKCAPLQVDVGKDTGDGKDYSRFKANNRTLPSKSDTCCKLTEHDTLMICGKAATACMNLKTATYVVKGEPYGGGPRLGQIASTWFESLAKSEVHNGELQKLLHLAEKGVKPATANLIPPRSFNDIFNSYYSSLPHPVIKLQESYHEQAGACGAECSLFDIFVDTVAQLVGRSAKDIRADLLAQHDRGLSPSPECCDKGIMADNHADCIPFCSPSSSFMTTRGRKMKDGGALHSMPASDQCPREKSYIESLAVIMPPEPGSLRIPSPFNPTTTHSEPSHQQHSGVLAGDDAEGKVDVIAIIKSPMQPKFEDKPAPLKSRAFEGVDMQRERKETQTVGSWEDMHLNTALDWPKTCVHCPDERMTGKLHSTSSAAVQPSLLPLASHDKSIHYDAGDSSQQGNNEDFQQFLWGLTKSPSPSPFLQPQDFSMDVPSLEHMLNAYSNKCVSSGSSGSASEQAKPKKCHAPTTSPSPRCQDLGSNASSVQDNQRALRLPALTTCLGLLVNHQEPETIMDRAMLPHSPSCVSVPHKVLCGGTIPPTDPFMDSLDRSETIEETSNLGEGLPKLQKANTCEIMSPLLGPSSSMHRSLSTDSNRAIASPRDDGTEHGEAVKNGWDMKTFMKSSKGTRERKAEPIPEEDLLSCKLRPAFADGLQRVLSKDMLQSVYHLPINEAAAQLHVGVTVLKKFCRQHNVGRWPYRKLQSVDKLIRSVDELSEQDPTGANFVIRELGILKREIYSNPEVKLDDRIKRLRQANFKVQYKQRQAIDGKSTVSNV